MDDKRLRLAIDPGVDDFEILVQLLERDGKKRELERLMEQANLEEILESSDIRPVLTNAKQAQLLVRPDAKQIFEKRVDEISTGGSGYNRPAVHTAFALLALERYKNEYDEISRPSYL